MVMASIYVQNFFFFFFSFGDELFLSNKVISHGIIMNIDMMVFSI